MISINGMTINRTDSVDQIVDKLYRIGRKIIFNVPNFEVLDITAKNVVLVAIASGLADKTTIDYRTLINDDISEQDFKQFISSVAVGLGIGLNEHIVIDISKISEYYKSFINEKVDDFYGSASKMYNVIIRGNNDIISREVAADIQEHLKIFNTVYNAI